MAVSERFKREFLERKYGKPTQGIYRGTQFISGEQIAQERALENEMKLQELKNLGNVDVAKTTGAFGIEGQKLSNIGQQNVARITREGYAEQQKLRNIGQRDITGMEQSGQTERENIRDRLERQKAADDRFKMLYELEGNVNMMRNKPIDIWQTYGGYQESPMAQLGQTNKTNQRKYNPMEVYDKSGKNLLRTDYFDSQGNIAYSKPVETTTPNVMGKTLPEVVVQAPLTKPGTETAKTKETFESRYGSKPTLKDIWAEDERRRKQKEADRKKLWSVPY